MKTLKNGKEPKNINIMPVTCEAHIKEVGAIAKEIWHEYYPSILSLEQIDYMVEKYQSQEAISRQLMDGYGYYMLLDTGGIIGYLALREEENKSLFLSKLYIHKKYRGLGYASDAFTFLVNLCIEKGYHKIWLTVNRYNKDTIKAYEKKGFVKVRTQAEDIGNGFVMDDYIMEKRIEKSF